jgi:ABC-type dipeptide/oligopeptide/nickel transport system ATPase component
VEAGPVEQILEHPTDPYTVRLIQDVPRLAAAGAGQIRSAVRLDPAVPGGPAAPATRPASPWSAP